MYRKHWCFDEDVDLLVVDVEGHELDVMTKKALDVLSPSVVLVETHNLESSELHELRVRLSRSGYEHGRIAGDTVGVGGEEWKSLLTHPVVDRANR